MSLSLFRVPETLPEGVRIYSADDLDEIRAQIGQPGGPSFRVARRDQPLGYTSYVARGGGVNVGWSQSAVAQSVRGNSLGFVFLLQLPESSIYRAGRRRLTPTTAGSVVAIPPRWECSRDSPPGRIVAVEIQPHVLDAELRARRGLAAERWIQRLSVLDAGALQRQALVDSVDELVAILNAGSDPLRLSLAEARLVGQVAGLSLRAGAPPRAGHLAVQRLRDLEDWIDAHLGDAITLGRLCEVAGVGDRSLQKAFEQGRGISPMRFVMERRLMAAHQLLLQSRRTEGATITDIATGAGFNHLGRFSQDYRQLFGETPSQTLARPDATRS